MSRQNVRRILHPGSPLEQRFQRIADLCDGVNEKSENDSFPQRSLPQKRKMNDHSSQTCKQEPGHTPLPCLFGTGEGCHRVPAEELAECKRRRIPGNDRQQEKIDKKRPECLPDQKYMIERETHVYRPEKCQGDHLREMHHLFQ